MWGHKASIIDVETVFLQGNLKEEIYMEAEAPSPEIKVIFYLLKDIGNDVQLPF